MSGTAGYATTRHETAAFFPAGAETLFGVLTSPTVQSRGLGVVVVSGGSPTMASFQRNRVAVRLARRLAALGCHVLRFDYHGVGDSTGRVDAFSLKRLFVEDVEAAVTWMRGWGIERFVLVGTCFGARTVLAASRRVVGLEGVVLAAMALAGDFHLAQADARTPLEYLRRGLRPETLRRLLDRERRGAYLRLVWNKARAVGRRLRRGLTNGASGSVLINPLLVEQLEGLIGRRIPVLVLFGTEDLYYRTFRRAQSEQLGRLVQRHSDLIEVSAEAEGEMHGFTTVAVQNAFCSGVERWIQRVVSAAGAAQA